MGLTQPLLTAPSRNIIPEVTVTGATPPSSPVLDLVTGQTVTSCSSAPMSDGVNTSSIAFIVAGEGAGHSVIVSTLVHHRADSSDVSVDVGDDQTVVTFQSSPCVRAGDDLSCPVGPKLGLTPNIGGNMTRIEEVGGLQEERATFCIAPPVPEQVDSLSIRSAGWRTGHTSTSAAPSVVGG